jgi:hypothetical protein
MQHSCFFRFISTIVHKILFSGMFPFATLAAGIVLYEEDLWIPATGQQ